jgi:hypothetical protein
MDDGVTKEWRCAKRRDEFNESENGYEHGDGAFGPIVRVVL